MLNKNIFLKVSEEGIQIKNKNLRLKHKGINPLKDIEGIKIKNKNVYIIVEGEEVHIKLLKLPKVSKWDLNSLIRNELIFLYGRKANNIFYTYTVLNETIEDIDVLVFCMNLKDVKALEKIISDNKIKKINIIQFNMLNYFKSYIKDKTYILIFKDENKIYFLGITYENLVANRIVNLESKNYEYFLMEGFNYCVNRIEKFTKGLENIYYVNFKEEEKDLYMQNHIYKYKDLGSVDKTKILQYFSIKRN
ncbi:putative conserved protein [Clostridium botulinum C str. Eklund]|nr:putative conserved protein [Clostridium botulinum C str. Eklund]